MILCFFYSDRPVNAQVMNISNVACTKGGQIDKRKRGVFMKNQTVTGIGCFARPERLRRIFLKMVQDYALGQIEGIDLTNKGKLGGTESTRLIEALITGKKLAPETPNAAIPEAPEYKKITGFYLTLKDQQLKLSIFAKKGNCRQERHSAVLDLLTDMRRSRLN